jgi:hypothetical protein
MKSLLTSLKLLFVLVYFLSVSHAFAQDILKIPATATKKAINCPMEGNPTATRKQAFYQERNRLKNRWNLPQSRSFDQTVTLQKMLGDGTSDVNKFNEKKAASIVGYIVYVSPSPWAESCNCGSTQSDYTDYHIEIAETPDEEKGGRTIVVESTPRIRAMNGPDWNRKALNKLWKEKIPVRISGWIFYDKEHESSARNIVGEECEKFANRRQTCWEIHPISKIEVLTESASTTLERKNIDLPPPSGTSDTDAQIKSADRDRLQGYPITTWLEIWICIASILSAAAAAAGMYLSYIIFRKQRQTEHFKIVQESLNWLRKDEYKINTIARAITLDLQQNKVPVDEFNRATYVLWEFKYILDYIEKHIRSEEVLKNKLGVLYRVIYQTDFADIYGVGRDYSQRQNNIIVFEFLLLLEEVNKRLQP